MSAPAVETALRPSVIRAATSATDIDLVEIQVDGTRWVAGVQLDRDEHQRRVAGGVGAVCDRRVLHALWELPAGAAVSTHSLRARDRATLESAHDAIVLRDENSFVRLFRPATTVRLAVVQTCGARDGLRRITSVPPIYERLVVSARSPSVADADAARRRGIGMIWNSAEGPKLVVSARSAEVGCPAVYRWWISEIAYEQWLSTTAPTG